MYMKISYKFHRIPDIQFHVVTKVYDFLGQPSYIFICIFMLICMVYTIGHYLSFYKKISCIFKLCDHKKKAVIAR